MEFIEKAKIMLEHWITHNEHHQEEYDMFADQLEGAEKTDCAKYVREMIALTSKSTECMKNALKSLK